MREQPELLRTLRALVGHPGSKSAAAAALNISRPVVYDRIARLERILGLSLDDAETRTSLHVALLADDVRRCLMPPRTPIRLRITATSPARTRRRIGGGAGC